LFNGLHEHSVASSNRSITGDTEFIMLRAGLTGGLGSGKTTVAAIFRSLGAHVIEADAIGRELMAPGQAVYHAIVQHFGSQVVNEDGSLNRRMLADLAFRHNRLDELNRIVHPPVVAAQLEWADGVFAQDANAVAIVESALIFEADAQGTAPGWRQRFDRVILVTAPDELKISRFVERMLQGTDAATRQRRRSEVEIDARARLAAQIPDKQKIPLCDYVIRNDGTLEDTRRQTERVFAELANAARVKSSQQALKSM
jgi:dephospho-CoA kinase